MKLISPKDGALVGGITRLVFDSPTPNFDVKVNHVNFHTTKDEKGYGLDLNDFLPGIPIHIQIHYHMDGSSHTEAITVYKPQHDLGGMGATVIRDQNGTIIGTFFKFWLPHVKSVYVRGSFNQWKDLNHLDQLGNSGYWYGFSADARPGDDYRFFVYGMDGKFDEVSDPAARDTIKTRFNDPEDAQDANAVIVDPKAFVWKHDDAYQEQRRDFRKHIIYQLHWGTFFRPGDGSNLPFEPFVAGDVEDEKRASVRSKLKYVRELGFTAIELLPIHEANGNFNAGYDPSFFFAVESTYGRPDDLRLLVDEAHGIGLAVIFDSVINHLTKDETRSSFSQEFIKGWYTKENAPWSNHMQWGGDDWGPDPDFDRVEIRNLLRDSVRMYFDEYHVDGIRFDATTTIPSQALKPMMAKLQQEYGGEGKYLIAEHLTDDPFPYIVSEVGLHAAWYKPAWQASTYQVLGQMGQGDLQKLRQIFETNHAGNPSTAIKYLLGSHDEVWASHGGQAAIRRLGGSSNFYARSKMRLAWALNVCSLGTPMLFMGTEAMTDISWHNYYGYNGKNDHTLEHGLDWIPQVGSYAEQFQIMIRDINELRLQFGALRTANTDCKLVHYDEKNSIVAYKRWDDFGCVLLIIINLSDNQWEHQEYQVYTDTPNSTWHEVFNSQAARYGGWVESENSNQPFHTQADSSRKLQGINVPKWSLMILKQQL